MRAIPPKMRKELEKEPFMKLCVHPGCMNSPEWEHCWTYARKQINEKWAIIPCCTFHHRGKGLDKDFNKWVSINLAIDEDFVKYPRFPWYQERARLNAQYGEDYMEFLLNHTKKCLLVT